MYRQSTQTTKDTDNLSQQTQTVDTDSHRYQSDTVSHGYHRQTQTDTDSRRHSRSHVWRSHTDTRQTQQVDIDKHRQTHTDTRTERDTDGRNKRPHTDTQRHAHPHPGTLGHIRTHTDTPGHTQARDRQNRQNRQAQSAVRLTQSTDIDREERGASNDPEWWSVSGGRTARARMRRGEREGEWRRVRVSQAMWAREERWERSERVRVGADETEAGGETERRVQRRREGLNCR